MSLCSWLIKNGTIKNGSTIGVLMSPSRIRVIATNPYAVSNVICQVAFLIQGPYSSRATERDAFGCFRIVILVSHVSNLRPYVLTAASLTLMSAQDMA